MSKNLFFLALMAFCPCVIAAAEEQTSAEQFSACMASSGGVTAAMLDCIGDETTRQDLRLNSAYAELMTLLPPPRKTQLREAQRAWIKYRDAHCKFYADSDGGTMATLNASDCFRAATESRAKELEGFK